MDDHDPREIACSLTSPELRERRALARETLTPHIERVARDGLEMEAIFPLSLRGDVETFVALEEAC